jgi:hypothetical protein
MAEPSPTSAPTPPEIILLPADAFFVRWLPLVAGADLAPQVEIALENLSPFPAAQLYYGYLVSPARTSALVFAAYQRRFSREEVARWDAAAVVLPEFLGLLGDAPAKPQFRVWHHDGGCVAAAWDGKDSLPLALVAAKAGDTSPAELQAALCTDLRARTGLTNAEVRVYRGSCGVERDARRDQLQFSLKPESGSAALATVLAAAAVETVDVRDRAFLLEQRRLRRRDLLLWRGLLVCLGGIAAALALEAGLVAGQQWLGRARTEMQARTDDVRGIETAQGLSARIEELTQKQLRPFEMLAVVNQLRPASIQFTRSVTVGLNKLEIEAQTLSAADVSQYEKQLRAAAGLTEVVTRDLRSRDGITSFVLTVTFKPEALRPEGKS